jgi:hypothetical protein
MPTLQLYAGGSSFETISPAFKSGPKLEIENFSFGTPFVFQAYYK